MICEYEVTIQITAPTKPINGNSQFKTFYPGDTVKAMPYLPPPEVKMKPSVITYNNYLIPLENLTRIEMPAAAQTKEEKVQEDIDKIMSGEFGKNISSARKNLITYGLVGTFIGLAAAIYFKKSVLLGCAVGFGGGLLANKMINPKPVVERKI